MVTHTFKPPVCLVGSSILTYPLYSLSTLLISVNTDFLSKPFSFALNLFVCNSFIGNLRNNQFFMLVIVIEDNLKSAQKKGVKVSKHMTYMETCG